MKPACFGVSTSCFLAEARRPQRKIFVYSSDAASQHPGHVMSCSCFISFRPCPGASSPQPSPSGEGAVIVFVFPCPSLLVPCTCTNSLRLCERKKQINSRQDAMPAKMFGVRTSINIEVLCDLVAFARDKHKISGQSAKYAKVFHIRTK